MDRYDTMIKNKVSSLEAVLKYLHSVNGAHRSDISKHTGIPYASVYYLLEILERDKLVYRQERGGRCDGRGRPRTMWYSVYDGSIHKYEVNFEVNGKMVCRVLGE